MLDSTLLPIRLDRASAAHPNKGHVDNPESKPAVKSATAFAHDVISEIAVSYPCVNRSMADGFADSIIGTDLRNMFLSPHAGRTWHDETFSSLEASSIDTLEARIAPLAAYTASAETVAHGTLYRTKLTPVELKLNSERPTGYIAGLVIWSLARSVKRTKALVYTAAGTKASFGDVCQRVALESTVPKGRILLGLQAPLEENRSLLKEHGADIAIVHVPGLKHPTYIATTLEGTVAGNREQTPTVLALCKLDHDPTSTELPLLDAFAHKMLHTV